MSGLEKLQARERARQEELAQRRDKPGSSDRTEAVAEFHVSFRKAIDACKQQIEWAKEAKQATSTQGKTATEHIDLATEQLKEAERVVAVHLAELPGYDQKQSQETLKNTEALISNTRAACAPKAKFSFGSRSAAPAPAAPAPAPAPAEISAAVAAVPAPEAAVVLGFRNLGEGTYTKARGELDGSDFDIEHVSDARIVINDWCGALRVVDVKDSVIKCGPVAGPVFVDGCENVDFFFAARQIRIHNTQGCKFFIYVASEPIIEDCDDMSFCHDVLAYPGKADLFVRAGLVDQSAASAAGERADALFASKSDGKWSLVKDFKWLKKAQSPHWRTLVHPGGNVAME